MNVRKSRAQKPNMMSWMKRIVMLFRRIETSWAAVTLIWAIVTAGFAAGAAYVTFVYYQKELRNDVQALVAWRDGKSGKDWVAGDELAAIEVPVGTIVPYFNKSNSAIPAGWHLCDGSDVPNTEQFKDLRNLVGQTFPDLRGRFLLGQNDSPIMHRSDHVPDIQSHSVGESSGSATHLLTIPELPKHIHGHAKTQPSKDNMDAVVGGFFVVAADNSSGQAEELYEVGENRSFNIMPPYMTILYIIKCNTID